MANEVRLNLVLGTFLAITPAVSTAQTSSDLPAETADRQQRADQCRTGIDNQSLRQTARSCVESCEAVHEPRSNLFCDAAYAKFRVLANANPASKAGTAASPATGSQKKPRGRNIQTYTGPITMQSVPDAIGYLHKRKGQFRFSNRDQNHTRLCGKRFEMKTEAGTAALKKLKNGTRIKLSDIEVPVMSDGNRKGYCKAGAVQVVER